MKKFKSKYIIVTIILIFSLLLSFSLTGCSFFQYYGNLFENLGANGNNQTNGYSPEEKARALSASIKILEDSGLQVNTVQNQDGPYSVTEVAQKVSDSIVNIEASFSTSRGAGSGILFAISSDKYYVVTNHHVVYGATNIVCELTDGTTKTATFVASDASCDIGVITIPKSGIDGTKYKTVTIPSDEYEVRVGDTAIAIGNSLGSLGGTVTAGIVSALNRKINVEDTEMYLTQTDTAINQGNSGGGLFDSYAQLIGVVNSKITNSGVEGLGFAIPIKTSVATACDLITKGYVTGRPAIGVMVRELNSKAKMDEFLSTLQGEELTAWNGYFASTNRALGLYIASVTNQDSGLETGDYLISFAGSSVISQDDLAAALWQKRAGDKVTIVVKRNGQQKSITMTLIEKIES